MRTCTKGAVARCWPLLRRSSCLSTSKTCFTRSAAVWPRCLKRSRYAQRRGAWPVQRSA